MPRPTTEKKGFIPVPSTVQVEMIYTSLNEVCENVYHVKVGAGTTSATEAQMDALAAVFNTWENAHGINVRGNVTALTNIRIRQLDTAEPLIKEYAPTGVVLGAGTATQCPGNVTAAIRWTTGAGGRSNRGRTYHIGLTNNMTNGNVLVIAFQTSLQSHYQSLLTAVNAVSGMALVIVSYSHNKLWRDVGVTRAITNCSVPAQIDSQRRRLMGRGT